MDLRDLAYFEAVAETEHLGRAAEKLGRSQPALTKSIKRLEASLGARLFERAGRGIRLTAVGEVLLTRARTLRKAVDETTREIGDFSRGDAGHVRIGTGATTAEYLLPTMFARLMAETKGVTIELTIAMNDVLRASLAGGHLDLVVGPISDLDNDGFDTHEAGRDEVVVMASRDHPLLRAGRPSLADLAGYRWVLAARSVGTRRWLDRVFDAADLPRPVVQIESNSLALLPRLIAQTDLLTFISRRNLDGGPGRAPMAEVALRETTMPRRLGTVCRQGQYLSPAALRLIELLRDDAGDALDTL